MEKQKFELILEKTRAKLELEAKTKGFKNSPEFENRVRLVLSDCLSENNEKQVVDFNSHVQAFPDICLGKFGLEVKFTEKDTWRGVANSVSQGMKDDAVEFIFIIWCKMGGKPEVMVRMYEDVVYHVRTSHVPRFEVDMTTQSSLFNKFKLKYSQFSELSQEQKMDYVRGYARSRLKRGINQFYWYLESQIVDKNSSTNIKFYGELSKEEQLRFSTEELLLFPFVVNSITPKQNLDDRIRYFLNKHSILYPPQDSLIKALLGKTPNTQDLETLIYPNISDLINAIDINLFRQYWFWYEATSLDTESITKIWHNEIHKHLK